MATEKKVFYLPELNNLRMQKDRVVAEKPDAAAEPEEFCRRVGAVLAAELAGLLTRGPGAPADRAARYLGG